MKTDAELKTGSALNPTLPKREGDGGREIAAQSAR